MLTKTRMLAIAGMLSVAMVAGPVMAVPTVSTDEATFDSTRNVTNFTFAFPSNTFTPAPSYTQNGVTFANPGQFEVSNFNEPVPYLTDLGVTTTITLNGSVLGLLLASGGPITYNFVGTSGTFTPGRIGSPSFIGFDTGSSTPVMLTLTSANGFDITGFQTASVPEPATWAMMLIGFGAVGFALRRRQTATTRVFYTACDSLS